jgi:hypothetical protein
MLKESIARVDRFRAAHPDHPIVDVQYDDLVRSPVETVASIYGAFDGAALDDGARRAMESYVAAHPKDALGVHRYDLAAYGLDADAIASRFAGYTARYDVPTAAR